MSFEISMNRVFKAPDFDKYANKLLSKADFKELNKFIVHLKNNSDIGKPLGYDFLREKKIGSKRVYSLVYEDICLILLVATSNKKTQQGTIDNIKLYLNEYKEYAYQIYTNIKK